MVIFLELFDDVSRHGDIERAFDVVPFEAYSTVEVAVPIFSEFIFFLDAIYQVVNVLLTRVFYSKIVDDKCECDGAGGVLPKAGRLFAFEVSVGAKRLRSSLLANIPACWRPQTARRISR